jgi:hypothetical protein
MWTLTWQALMVIFLTFAGGLFIHDDDVPVYWSWIKEISIFEHGIKATTMGAFEFLELKCPATSVVDGTPFGYEPSAFF